ncbi:hypothetical protein E4T80_12055 [Muribacter muris]|uniref:MmcQ/YjbR family DNA-binding protein n=1 Tax=Muribacter muris TaxID=67855 RepID=A0A4Y9JT65_9PAST|nr:MmcQ/YjbR family DNA-binding protein [Muribacter muris]MBF0786194.1 MmcQ/YjbR family DNA-binding protein [Muribacter muris]MBF0826263.1 MmcQ/YjbR family DNA-binding protein [Muribacter muris]TFV07666.1 hypothetical protein E4T80_12055 [Muribacter muris]
MSQRQAIFDYVAQQYAVALEYLWAKLPSYAVLRHCNKKGKWFALIANVSKTKLGLTGEGTADILNIKCEPDVVSILRQDKNVLPAYHMNKRHWLTIVLDSDFELDEIYKLLDWSYRLTLK